MLNARWSTTEAGETHRAACLDVVAERAAAVGVGLLIVTGFTSSYTTLRDLAVEVGGFSPWLAPVVPLSFDLGIVVLSLKVVLAARAGQDARVLRALVLLLSAATVVANGAASSTTVGRLLHAVPPAMFVVCFETLAASARHDARTRRAVARQDIPVPDVLPVLTAARWLLAPRQTWSIWRTRILGGALQTPTRSAPMLPAPAARPASPMKLGRPLLGDLAAQTTTLSSSTDANHGWQVDDRSAPPVMDAEPPRLPLASGHETLTPDGSGPASHCDRLAVAVEALRADPVMTAVALAEHLAGAGHPVSVRTAQRVRHHAEQHLNTRPPDTDDLSAARADESRTG